REFPGRSSLSSKSPATRRRSRSTTCGCRPSGTSLPQSWSLERWRTRRRASSAEQSSYVSNHTDVRRDVRKSKTNSQRPVNELTRDRTGSEHGQTLALRTRGGEMSVQLHTSVLKGRQTCRFLVRSSAVTAA